MFRHKKLTGQLAYSLCTLAICLFAFVGCSSDSNPAGPDQNPTPVVKKPAHIVVSSIQVNGFKNKDGDASELINAWKKADIYVTLARTGGGEDFVSDVRQDASPSSNYTFTKTGVPLGKNLPLSYLYVDKLTIKLYDRDVFSNEIMSTITFDPKDLYANDEATTFSKSLTGANGAKITVRGEWKY